MSEPLPAPAIMGDDALCDELMDTVRYARSHGEGSWDRPRLRAVVDEIDKARLAQAQARRCRVARGRSRMTRDRRSRIESRHRFLVAREKFLARLHMAHDFIEADEVLREVPDGRWVTPPASRWWHHWNGNGQPYGLNAAACASTHHLLPARDRELVEYMTKDGKRTMAFTFAGRWPIVTTNGPKPSRVYQTVPRVSPQPLPIPERQRRLGARHRALPRVETRIIRVALGMDPPDESNHAEA